MELATIRALFEYNDWARDRLMAIAETLDDDKLDRPFEMGPGSLRKTLEHLFAAEWRWLRRWRGRPFGENEWPRGFAAMAELWATWRETAQQRSDYLDTLADNDLDRRVCFTDPDGTTESLELRRMMLHVCTHGTHHRAQALNMLRHVGVEPPSLYFGQMHV